MLDDATSSLFFAAKAIAGLCRRRAEVYGTLTGRTYESRLDLRVCHRHLVLALCVLDTGEFRLGAREIWNASLEHCAYIESSLEQELGRAGLE